MFPVRTSYEDTFYKPEMVEEAPNFDCFVESKWSEEEIELLKSVFDEGNLSLDSPSCSGAVKGDEGNGGSYLSPIEPVGLDCLNRMNHNVEIQQSADPSSSPPPLHNVHGFKSLEAPYQLPLYTSEEYHKDLSGLKIALESTVALEPELQHLWVNCCWEGDELVQSLPKGDDEDHSRFGDVKQCQIMKTNACNDEPEDELVSLLDDMLAQIRTQQGIDFAPAIASCSEPKDVDLLATQITNHPLFFHVVAATIDCYKIGANEEEAKGLDYMARSMFPHQLNAPERVVEDSSPSVVTTDPRLDSCLEKYLQCMQEFKLELEKVTTSATTFSKQMKQKIYFQCPDLGENLDQKKSEIGSVSVDKLDYNSSRKKKQESRSANDGAVSSTQNARLNDDDWKGAILATYDSTVLSQLKMKHLKEGRKNAKLPDSARGLLKEWWDAHNKNPYPSEDEKVYLSRQTGLELDQINNWFINQRKRHCCGLFTDTHSKHASDCYKMTGPRR